MTYVMHSKGRRRWRACVAVWLIMLSSGCAQLVNPPVEPVAYDFGQPPRVALDPALRPAGVVVDAPSWLAGTAIQYRLAYAGQLVRHAYLESGWLARPTEMLAEQLSRSFGLSGVGNECRLELVLREMIQVFERDNAATLAFEVDVQLRHLRLRRSLADTRVVLSVPTPSADALGAVKATRVAIDRLTANLAEWLASTPAQCLTKRDGDG